MKLEIKNNKTYNCMQNLIAAVAHNGNRDYRMMMLELWGFRYEKSNQNFGERLGLSWSGNLEYRRKLLLDFHGISMEWKYKISDIQDLGSYVENNPVAFYTDSYDCEWLPFYHKQHRSHLCNIVSAEDNICYCQDEYTVDSNYKEFAKDSILYSRALVFNYENQKNIFDSQIVYALQQKKEKYDKENCLIQIRKFAEDFIKEFDIATEVKEGEDIVASKLIMYLKNLGDDRSNLSQFFEYCNVYMPCDYMKINKLLFEVSKCYNMLRNYIIKIYFAKMEIDNDIIKRIIEQICRCEYEIYTFIKEMC